MTLVKFIKADLYRYCGDNKFKSFIKCYFLYPGFKFMFWHRVTSSFRGRNKIIYALLWYRLRQLKFRFGYDIPVKTNIGKGFYIGHFSGVVISSEAVIGINCNISQGVTIGYSSRGKRKGYPIIGDNVYIGPGAVVIGNIKVGNNVAIGANTVVIDDIPDYGVVVGMSGKIINFNGSEGYILNPVT